MTPARHPATPSDLDVSAGALAAIEAVCAAHPDLTWHGLGPLRDPRNFEPLRARMVLPGAVEEFRRALAFLQAAPEPSGRINRRFDAYAWKGVAERWAGGYVSEGMFLAAALHLGFRVERDATGRCAFLDLPPAALTLAPRFATGNRAASGVARRPGR